MAHFGSVDWNNPSGLVAQLTSGSLTWVTGTSATTGTDKLVYTTVRAGMYRLSAYATTRTVGSATQTAVAQAAYTDSVGAVSVRDIAFLGVTATKLDLATGNAHMVQSQVIVAAAGTTITITMSGAGTATLAGIYDLNLAIEAI